MSVVRNLMLRAGADFSGMQKAMNKAARQTKQFRADFSNTAKRIMQVSIIVGAAVAAASKVAIAAAQEENIAHVKLATVMKQRMNATDDMVKSIIDMASAQQNLGVIEDDVTVSGAQMLATFLTQTQSLKTLIPAMNDLAAQQYGLEASSSDLVNVGKMMGKVFTGQTGALKKAGITFSEAEEQVLKFGTESQKAAMLAQVITNNVGHMNEALANTPAGRIKQLVNSFSDLKEKFGDAIMPLRDVFVPVLQNAINYLSSFIDRMQPSIQYAQIFLETLFNVKAAKNAASAASATKKEADAVNDLGDATKSATKNLLSFDEVNNLSDSSGSSLADETDDAVESQYNLNDAILLTQEQIAKAQQAAKDFKDAFNDVKNTVITLGPLLLGILGTIALIKTGAAAVSFFNAFSTLTTALGAAKGLNTVIATIGPTAATAGGIMATSFAAWAGIIGAAAADMYLIVKYANGARAAVQGYEDQVNDTIRLIDVNQKATSTMTPEQKAWYVEASKQLQATKGTYGEGEDMSFGITNWIAGVKKIFGFADGGFPDRGQMFLANENGPELIGTMGGQSAVANQNQITDGIRQAVRDELGSGENTTILQLDGREVQRWTSKSLSWHSVRTGGAG